MPEHRAAARGRHAVRAVGHANGDNPISIVVPCHNGGRYIDGLLASLAAQTFRDFELIVVDDGSTDNTEQVLKTYGDRLRYVRQENRGGGAAQHHQVMQGSHRHARKMERARARIIALQAPFSLPLEHRLKHLSFRLQRQFVTAGLGGQVHVAQVLAI